MGGLQRQIVPVLLKGLDQLAPRQTGIMSGLDALLNMYAQQGEQAGYEFVPRPGTTTITKPVNPSAAYRIATLGGQLLMFTDFGAFRRATDGWHGVDGNGGSSTGNPFTSQTTKPMFCEATAATSCDSVYVGGYTVRAVSDGTVLNVSVVDANGDALDSPFVSVVGGATLRVTGNGPSFPRCIAAQNGGSVLVAWFNTATNTIEGNRYTLGGSFSGTNTIIASAVSVGFSPPFDVQAVGTGNNVAVLWNDNATSNLSQLLLNMVSMTPGATTAYGAKGTNFVTKGYLANNFSTAVLFVAFISSATGLHVAQFDSTTLAAGTDTVYDAASTAGASITGYRSGTTTAVVYWTVKGTLPYDDQIKTSNGAAATLFLHGRAVASRTTILNASNIQPPFMLTKYRGVGQVTYFMVNGGGIDIARSMPDVGGADPANTLVGLLSLPNLSVGASANSYVTSALSSTAIQTGASGLFSNTGASTITVTVDDITVGAPVELNQSLHFPGALPMVYDGSIITVEGFPLAPEQSDAYVLAGGGSLTASSTYTYRYVYEWTDNNSNLYQSAPNLIAQQAVLGVGQTKVTHALPNVLPSTTVLRNVYIAVYRTVANGDGSVYYRVGSVLVLGIGSRATFVDTMSDTTLVGQAPLYTNGVILENLAPPPCMTMVAHRGRLLAGGIDGDPTAIWQSKQVTPGFGVSFNDGLVSRLGGSTDPITALGSMDSYAAAFTASTTWSSSDDYPDDTGAPGMLRFSQSSSTNGCAGARLIARADDGLTCWQAKTAVVGGPGPGPWRLSRGLAWEWIGQAAQLDSAAFTTLRTIFAVPGLNQMRIVGQTATVNGNVLVRETTFETWATWTYLVSTPTIVDAITWRGVPVYLTSTGNILLESAAVYSDNATAIAHSLTFSPFNFAGVAGYQRIYVGQPTGRILGTAGAGQSLRLDITQIPDGVAMTPKSLTLTPDANALFGGVEFDPGPNGKCSAYQVTISNIAGAPNNAGCAWTLAALTMEVGIKPNVNRLPPANRAL